MTPPRRVEFHPDAILDARAARAWSAARSSQAVHAFEEELDWAVASVAETPLIWPQVDVGFRRCLLRGFPFSVVYRLTDEAVQVLAVAHARRRPGFWRSRAE
jgi:plasmid stabilization system protein ParE